MAEFLSPGVFIQEKKSAAQAVSGVSTSTFATVGWLPRGKTDEPILVGSLAEYFRTFGEYWVNSDVPLAMTAFFQNGGARAYVVRVVPTDALPSEVTVPTDLWKFEAISAGTWGNAVRVGLRGNTNYYDYDTATYSKFDLIVQEESADGEGDFEQTEIFEALDLVADSGEDGILTVINDEDTGSGTVKVEKINGGVPADFASNGVTDEALGVGDGLADQTINADLAMDAQAPYTIKVRVGDVEKTSVTTVADVAGSLDGTYFILQDSAGSVAFWYDISGTTTEPVHGADRAVEITTVLTGDAANLVATKTATAINADSAFAAPAPAGAEIIVTDAEAGVRAAAVAGTSGFTIAQSAPGSALTDVAIDDGNGVIAEVTGSGFTSISGTIDYTDGTLSVEFVPAPNLDAKITTNYYQAGESELWWDLAGGTEGTSVSRSEVTSHALETDESGLYALNKIDEIMNIGLPDFAGDEIVHGDLIAYCENKKDKFAILDTSPGLTATKAKVYKQRTLASTSSYGAMYWPNVKVADPLLGGRNKVISPVGHVAGVYARTDANRNVGKAPAGVEDGALNFVVDTEFPVTQAMRDTVYPVNINPLKVDPLTGKVVWGARTLQVVGDYSLVNVRRLFQFLEKSLYNASQDLVFEPLGDELFARTKLRFDGFLEGLTQLGYFASRDPSKSFRVTVDRSNNSDATIAQRLLIADILVAPQTPAEFVLLRFERSLNELS
jgi:hypothetical protein